MARFNVNVKIDVDKIKRFETEAKEAAERGMSDVIDDLVRTSSETAPHYHGVLEKSYSKDVKWSGGRIEGIVEYSVNESDDNGNHFNYALWTHESDYNLGPESIAKPGGTGMSGNHYAVGNKYLTRPLEGEKDMYKEHIANEIRKELR